MKKAEHLAEESLLNLKRKVKELQAVKDAAEDLINEIYQAGHENVPAYKELYEKWTKLNADYENNTHEK